MNVHPPGLLIQTKEKSSLDWNSSSYDETSSKEHSKMLQHFEYSVLVEVEKLGDMAFSAEITRRLSKSLNRHVALAQVFGTLERLEDKGFVSSRDSHPEPVRGGRRRRIFRMETSGLQALRNTAATYRRSSPSNEVETLSVRAQAGRPLPA